MRLARRLRTALQSRLSATVVLTRESDVALTNEARAAVANNNQADLFISLHTGYSLDKTASGSSIYVMKARFHRRFRRARRADACSSPGTWPIASARPPARRWRNSCNRTLNQALPGWKFPIRHAPIGVLASATMPSVAIEIGNFNNDASVKTLADRNFRQSSPRPSPPG